MTAIFPQLANTRIDYCWGGLVDMSMDRMVHAGEHDGFYYSLGYCGHGVQMATYMGKQMALYITENPHETSGSTFRTEPSLATSARPWFLPFIGGYAKVVDRFS